MAEQATPLKIPIIGMAIAPKPRPTPKSALRLSSGKTSARIPVTAANPSATARRLRQTRRRASRVTASSDQLGKGPLLSVPRSGPESPVHEARSTAYEEPWNCPPVHGRQLRLARLARHRHCLRRRELWRSAGSGSRNSPAASQPGAAQKRQAAPHLPVQHIVCPGPRDSRTVSRSLEPSPSDLSAARAPTAPARVIRSCHSFPRLRRPACHAVYASRREKL